MRKVEKKFFVEGIFASGMVLQRNTENCICGGGADNKVQLEFRGKKYEAGLSSNTY